nr:MAG TPA: hypothetical protein [Caudoviricetes sp.]
MRGGEAWRDREVRIEIRRKTYGLKVEEHAFLKTLRRN